MLKVTMLAAVGVLLSGSSVLAVESTAQAPVKILSCVVARNDSKSNSLGGVAYTNGVTAIVTNVSTKAISDMQFSGIYNGETVTTTVTGAFPAGMSETLHKTLTPRVYTGPDASCVLNHVTFADGTTWKMPMPPMMMK